MLKQYPVYKRFEAVEIFNGFKKETQEALNKYIEGLDVNDSRKKDLKREMIKCIHSFGDDWQKLSVKVTKEQIPLNLYKEHLKLLDDSSLCIQVKNDDKCYFRNFLKQEFFDWPSRFSNFDAVHLKNAENNEEKINASAILGKEDIKKLMQHETRMYWKAFFITQYELGARTKEVRLLKWKDIKFNVDNELSEVNIFATKTGKARTIFIKEATFYLQKLREEQKNLDKEGIYIFHSRGDVNKPVDKNTTNVWARELSKKTGIKFWPYLLRHSRATELYTLAHENKIAEDTAVQFMGHHRSMINTYLHLNKNKVKDMLKNQVYKLEELPPEKKAEFEKEIANLEGKYQDLLSKVGKLMDSKKIRV